MRTSIFLLLTLAVLAGCSTPQTQPAPEVHAEGVPILDDIPILKFFFQRKKQPQDC